MQIGFNAKSLLLYLFDTQYLKYFIILRRNYITNLKYSKNDLYRERQQV